MNATTSSLEEPTGSLDEGMPPSLQRARTLARLLDESFGIPGTRFRFGIDPVLGLVPVLGDSVALLGSLYIILTGVRLGAPLRVVATMVLLVGIDWVIGSVPVVGTVVDAVLKANKRNVAMLERHVRRSH